MPLRRKRRNALLRFPAERYQRTSHRHSVPKTHRTTRPPGFTSLEGARETACRSATQFKPEKLERTPSSSLVGSKSGVVVRIWFSVCFLKKASDSLRQLVNTNTTLAELNAERRSGSGCAMSRRRRNSGGSGRAGGLIPSIAAAGGAGAGAAVAGWPGAIVGTATAHQLARLVQSPAWLNRVSAPMKDALATALASGNAPRIAGAVRRLIASLPAELRQSLATE